MKSAASSLTASIMTAVALAGLSASAAPHVPVFVVIQNQAGVPSQVLGRAIQVVTDAYRPFGIGIAWIEPPVRVSAGRTVHLTILRRTAGREAGGKMLGIDAPGDADARVHVAHILYQSIDDDVVTSHVLGYVMAHLIRGALSNGGTARSTIIQADRHAGRRLAKGLSVFHPEEAEAIRKALRY